MDNIRIPSYYTIIPASVRYDHQLSYFQIVLFGEIVSMTTVLGYAFVSNSYLASLYQRDDKAISKDISKLAARGHIRIEIDKQNGNERKLYILTPPIVKKDNTPIVKKDNPSHVRQNASLFNKEIFNNSNPQAPSGDVQPMPVKRIRKPRKNEVPDVVIPWLDDYIKSLK
jgi:hypothetical protein